MAETSALPGIAGTSVAASTAGEFIAARFVLARTRHTVAKERKRRTLLGARRPPASDGRHRGTLPPWVTRRNIRERQEQIR